MEQLSKNVFFVEWGNINTILKNLINKKLININLLLDYLKIIFKFDDYLNLDINKKNEILDSNLTYLNIKENVDISILYYFYNDNRNYYFNLQDNIFNDIYNLIILCIGNEKINKNNIKFLLFICLGNLYNINFKPAHLYYNNNKFLYKALNNIKDGHTYYECNNKIYKNNKDNFLNLIKCIIDNNLIDNNTLFIEFVELIYKVNEYYYKYAILDKYNDNFFLNILWENVKYDKNILSCLINNYPSYHSYNKYINYSVFIKHLLDLYIYPDKDEVFKLLQTNFEYKDLLIKKNKLDSNEILLYINNINDLIKLIKNNNIKLTDELKEKIMYFASIEPCTESEFKKLKNKYKLNYNDKCLELYCNSNFNLKNINGFIYLINEGCKVRSQDLMKFLLNISGKELFHKIVNLMLTKNCII